MEYSKEYNSLLLKTSAIGRWIFKHLYLQHTQKLFKGNVIDFGCGVGNYLVGLKNIDCLGLDVNPYSIEECKKKGIRAEIYDHEKDDYGFTTIPTGAYNTMLISHVLEHLDNPNEILTKILVACDKLKIERIIIKVPSKKGFNLFPYPIHRTFIDENYLNSKQLISIAGFRVQKMYYFPFNLKWIGNIFSYNEFIVVYDRN